MKQTHLIKASLTLYVGICADTDQAAKAAAQDVAQALRDMDSCYVPIFTLAGQDTSDPFGHGDQYEVGAIDVDHLGDSCPGVILVRDGTDERIGYIPDVFGPHDVLDYPPQPKPPTVYVYQWDTDSGNDCEVYLTADLAAEACCKDILSYFSPSDDDDGKGTLTKMRESASGGRWIEAWDVWKDRDETLLDLPNHGWCSWDGHTPWENVNR